MLIYLPAAKYSVDLFMQLLFSTKISLNYFVIVLTIISLFYTILNEFHDVAFHDVALMPTYFGIGIIGLAMLAVNLAIAAVDLDLSGVPVEVLTMIRAPDSAVPFHILFTLMIFSKIFYGRPIRISCNG